MGSHGGYTLTKYFSDGKKHQRFFGLGGASTAWLMAMQERGELWEWEVAEQNNGWMTFPGKTNISPGKIMEVAEKLICPLKIDGWKMKFPFEIVPFEWTFVNFRRYMQITMHSLNTLVSPSTLRPTSTWRRPTRISTPKPQSQKIPLEMSLRRLRKIMVSWIMDTLIGKASLFKF